MQKDKNDQINNASKRASSNKSNMTEIEPLISSQQIINNRNLKKENSLSEMNDSNNYINNKIQEEYKKILKSESFKKDNVSNIKINTSYSNYKNYKNNMEHVIINSKEKKVPNLIRNIHYRPDIKKNNDNLRYQPLSSLEQKLSKQLSRLSNKYTSMKNRKFFNNQLTNTNLYWMNFPDYEIYRQLKVLETRKEFPYSFSKPKLKPLIYQKKDKLGVLAKNLYEADQVERFKKFLKKQYKIKVGE